MTIDSLNTTVRVTYIFEKVEFIIKVLNFLQLFEFDKNKKITVNLNYFNLQFYKKNKKQNY